ncbi:hypothetical protein Syun_030601 [Stephania yunnanensis]|uniref:Uncharacterized protein n=1 Tax=Stephania yunnanensis TaxID=152371 RepID=A0AAP0HAN0_9MAGN
MASNGNEANDSNFSSPMPAVGLDIAGATLVCLVLILSDIFIALRQRKPWIPCRFFGLNSFTLTILSVATKLPVDLTTSMPSAYDQLSKLCGGALICISIGIFGTSITEVIGHFKNGGCVGDFLDCGHGIVDKYLLKIVCHEVYEIINIIGEQRVLDSTISNATNAHVEKLYNDIEELFVELLHSVMDQLPDVIFESLNDNVPFVEFEENVKTSMELVARLNPLEVEPWWFKLTTSIASWPRKYY